MPWLGAGTTTSVYAPTYTAEHELVTRDFVPPLRAGLLTACGM